jgi:hypothetical protein
MGVAAAAPNSVVVVVLPAPTTSTVRRAVEDALGAVAHPPITVDVPPLPKKPT